MQVQFRVFGTRLPITIIEPEDTRRNLALETVYLGCFVHRVYPFFRPQFSSTFPSQLIVFFGTSF